MLDLFLGTSTSNLSGFQMVAAVLACLVFAFIVVMMFGVSWCDAYLQKMKKKILDNPLSVEKAYKKESVDKDKVRFYVKFEKEHELHSKRLGRCHYIAIRSRRGFKEGRNTIGG